MALRGLLIARLQDLADMDRDLALRVMGHIKEIDREYQDMLGEERDVSAQRLSGWIEAAEADIGLSEEGLSIAQLITRFIDRMLVRPVVVRAYSLMGRPRTSVASYFLPEFVLNAIYGRSSDAALIQNLGAYGDLLGAK